VPEPLDSLDKHTQAGTVQVMATALRTPVSKSPAAKSEHSGIPVESIGDVDDIYVTEVAGALIARLREVAHSTDAHLYEVLGGAEDLALRVVATIPSPSRLAMQIGPVYRQSDLAKARGCTRQAIKDSINKRRVLALTTADDVTVIPAFQLGPDLRPLPGLEEVLKILTPEVMDDWTLVSWLNAPQAQLGERSVIEALREGSNLDDVRIVTVATQRRWVS